VIFAEPMRTAIATFGSTLKDTFGSTLKDMGNVVVICA
jgi:hypothetical protein